MDKKSSNIIVLTESSRAFQRESGLIQTPYEVEVELYSLVQKGETKKAVEALHTLIETGLIVGKMSSNPLRQMQYWAVSCITLGSRYAIQGGLDQMLVYNLSDKYIQLIDGVKYDYEILDLIEKAVVEITTLVHNQIRNKVSMPIKKCLSYIQRHLHEKILIQDLSENAGLSRDYLLKLFKKEMKCTPHKFILNAKLDEAKSMIEEGREPSVISYTLGFCSQTHFIQLFKKKFGITPNNYKKAL